MSRCVGLEWRIWWRMYRCICVVDVERVGGGRIGCAILLERDAAVRLYPSWLAAAFRLLPARRRLHHASLHALTPLPSVVWFIHLTIAPCACPHRCARHCRAAPLLPATVLVWEREPALPPRGAAPVSPRSVSSAFMDLGADIRLATTRVE